jgi:predicted RNase H-like HicB family nuclease
VGGEEMRFAIVIEKDKKNFYVAHCPALPGCHSQGKTREEALANITEAIKGYIASLRKHGETIPTSDIEQIEVGV